MQLIADWDWVEETAVHDAVGVLEVCLSEYGDWTACEDSFCLPFFKPLAGGRPSPVDGLVGRVDFLCGSGGVLEVKTKGGELDFADKAQVVVYALALVVQGTLSPDGVHVLLNTRTGETWTVQLPEMQEDHALRWLRTIVKEQMQLSGVPDFFLMSVEWQEA